MSSPTDDDAPPTVPSQDAVAPSSAQPSSPAAAPPVPADSIGDDETALNIQAISLPEDTDQSLAVPSDKTRRGPRDDFEEGDMLGPLYRVVRKLGEGGMGAVYEVEHVRMQKRFAGKVLKWELCTPEHIQRLEREAMAASSIEHPNICRVVNFDETRDGRAFLICELLEGGDLSHSVQDGPIPIAEALNVAYQVASALDATHRERIVHRDLKPENIFLTQKDGQTVVKVLDFGVSKVDSAEEARLTSAGAVVGTPVYMSPENAHGEADLDARADIYSLGVILYEMLTGTVPFMGTKALDIMFQHIHEAPEPPSARRPELPPEFDPFVLKALEKSPEDRYQSMAEFRHAIYELGGQFGFSPVVQPEATYDGGGAYYPTPGHGTTPVGTRGASGRLAALLAVALLAAAGAAMYTQRQKPTEASSRPAPTKAVRTAPVEPKVTPPAKVSVEFGSVPPGAQVFANNKLLGETPIAVEMESVDAPVAIKFVKNGYKAVDDTLVTSKRRTLVATLERKAPVRPAPRARPAAKPKPAAPTLPKIKTTR